MVIDNLEDIKKLIAHCVEDSRANRPYCYKGRPYCRVESVTSTMTQEAYNHLLMLRDEAKCRWELFENDKLSFRDMEKMKSEHCSEPQNPLIANVLYKRKLLESWGRGISLINEECQKAKLPEPEFKLSNGFVKLIFRYGSTHHISTTQAPHKHHICTTQVQSLLNRMEHNTYSVKEMMALLGLNNRSYFSKEYLKPAVDMGALEPIFPNQPKNPKQKYRLTEKGEVLLKKG